MIDLLSDDELELAIHAAKREYLRLKRIRSRRRYAKTIQANPDLNARKFTPEVRARMSQAQKGVPRSEAAKEAVRLGMLASWRRRKAAASSSP